MPSNRIGLAFSNGLGNLIIYSAIVKILRQRHPEASLELITDPQMLEKSSAIKDLIPYIFDSVSTEYNKSQKVLSPYNEVIFSDWSLPRFVDDSVYKRRDIPWRDGVHELDIYLDAIMASQSEFMGLIMPVAEEPLLLKVPSPRVVFANASNTKGTARGNILGWKGFPELSKVLQSLGYNIILVGQEGELNDCWGENFINQLDIFQTAKVIQQCDLMVCTDTGLMHVADALNVPILLLMGPSSVTKSHPLVSKYNVLRKYISCTPCFGTNLWRDCKSRECMSLIKVEDVVKKVIKILPRKTIVASSKVSDSKLDFMRFGGIGDVLACLPALKACKDKGHKISLYTHWPEIIQNQPCIDKVVKIDSIIPHTISMTYSLDDLHGGGSLPDVIARKLNVKLYNQYIPFVYSTEEIQLIERLRQEKFVFVNNQTGSQNWSINHRIRDDIFISIMKHLVDKKIKVNLIGVKDTDLVNLPKGINDLRGKTSLREALCYFQAAQFAITLPAFWGNVHKNTKTPIMMLHTGYAHPDLLRSPWSICVLPEFPCNRRYCAVQKVRCKDWDKCQPNIKTILSILDNTFLRLPEVIYLLAFKNRFKMMKRSLESFDSSWPIPGTLILYDDNCIDHRITNFAKSYKAKSCLTTLYYKARKVHDPRKSSDSWWTDTANERLDIAVNLKPDYIVLMDDDCLYHPFWMQKLIGIFENDLKDQKVIAMSPLDIDHHDGHFDEDSYTIHESLYGGAYRFKQGFGGACYVIPFDKLDDHGYFIGGDTAQSPLLIKKGFKFATLYPSMVQHLGASASILRNHRIGDVAWSF